MTTRNFLFINLLSAVVMSVSCTSRDARGSEEDVPEVDVAQVIVDSVVTHSEYPGYLTANDEVDMVARVTGDLLSKPYAAGSHVSRGTVLFTIDARTYQDAVNQAAAQLDDARAQYDYNVKNYDAMKRAYSSDAVSQMEMLQAESAVKTSKAAIDEALASLRTAETNLSHCTIRAPFDGSVSVCNYSAGAFLDGSASPMTLCRLYDDKVMVANFSVDDSQYSKILSDNKLRSELGAIPMKFDETLSNSYTGRLSYLAPDVSRSTGTVNLQAHIQNPDRELRSGMFVRVMLPTAILPRAMLVNDDAISMSQVGHYIYLIDSLDRVVMTPIEVGETVNDTMRIVTKGVNPGDRYVTRALLKVRDGMKVNPRLTD
jgi:RND family efflux transporter MFP subunit